MTATAILNAVKYCKKCDETKAVDQFPSRHGAPFGCVCKACICLRQNLRYAKLKGTEEQNKWNMQSQALFKVGERQCRTCIQVKPTDVFRRKGKAFSHECLDCSNAAERAAYAANLNGKRDRLQLVGRQRRLVHADRLNQQKRVYVAANRAKVTQRQNDWSKAKLRADPVFALKKRIRSLVSNSFLSVGSRKNKETQQILGCTFEQFMTHIERQFTKGMSWERMGGEIHIDHILPLATAKDAHDVLALNHFTNLRPMWATENISKGAQLLVLI